VAALSYRVPNRPRFPTTLASFDDRVLASKAVARRMLRDAVLMVLAFLALTALFHLAR
jgi:hypothetical protein